MSNDRGRKKKYKEKVIIEFQPGTTVNIQGKTVRTHLKMFVKFELGRQQKWMKIFK